MSKIQTVKTVSELRRLTTPWRRNDQRIGFVPTMGALHAGHVSLIDEARTQCDKVIVSIFVNPTQFDRPDDLKRYPRPVEQDIALCEKHGADMVFIPSEQEVYPNGYRTIVHVDDITSRWEGAHRKGHFDGVTTVVAKLLMIVLADAAFFGEKDYQQLLVVKALTEDLNIPTRITPVKTMREADGLALSSRNVHLNAEQRKTAPGFHKILQDVASRIKGGESPSHVIAHAIGQMREIGFDRVDYIAACNEYDLAPLTAPASKGRVLGAAWLGTTRLIDNVAIESV